MPEEVAVVVCSLASGYTSEQKRRLQELGIVVERKDAGEEWGEEEPGNTERKRKRRTKERGRIPRRNLTHG